MYTITPQTRIVALDLETTGLSAGRHRVVELAAVCWQNGEETGHFQTLVHPGCPIPSRVIQVHGITDAMVQGQPSIAEVLPAFLAFCEADFVVAHNAPFDIRFINAECARIGLTPFAGRVIDTCSLAKQRLPGCPNYRLETLKALLGLGVGVAHRGLADARDCLAIFLRCMRSEAPALRPLSPPATLPATLQPLGDALSTGSTVMIEYVDARGRLTQREIRPLFIDQQTVQAHCLMRNDTRYFTLNRIQRVWLLG